MLTRSSRTLVKLGALALVLAGSNGCTPDVHVHIYNSDGDGDDTSGTGAPTPTPMPETFTTGQTTQTSNPNTTNNPTNDPTTDTADPTTDTADPTTDTADPTTDTADPTTDSESEGDSTGETTDSGGTTSMYPQPVDGMCDDEFRYNATAEHEYCAPPCPAAGPCPSAPTGDAIPGCAFNPDSTNTACNPADDMCEGDETCVGGTCRLAASHCGLGCQTTCPDGMECSPMSACRYPIP